MSKIPMEVIILLNTEAGTRLVKPRERTMKHLDMTRLTVTAMDILLRITVHSLQVRTMAQRTSPITDFTHHTSHIMEAKTTMRTGLKKAMLIEVTTHMDPIIKVETMRTVLPVITQPVVITLLTEATMTPQKYTGTPMSSRKVITMKRTTITGTRILRLNNRSPGIPTADTPLKTRTIEVITVNTARTLMKSMCTVELLTKVSTMEKALMRATKGVATIMTTSTLLMANVTANRTLMGATTLKITIPQKMPVTLPMVMRNLHMVMRNKLLVNTQNMHMAVTLRMASTVRRRTDIILKLKIMENTLNISPIRIMAVTNTILAINCQNTVVLFEYMNVAIAVLYIDIRQALEVMKTIRLVLDMPSVVTIPLVMAHIILTRRKRPMQGILPLTRRTLTIVPLLNDILATVHLLLWLITPGGNLIILDMTHEGHMVDRFRILQRSTSFMTDRPTLRPIIALTGTLLPTQRPEIGCRMDHRRIPRPILMTPQPGSPATPKNCSISTDQPDSPPLILTKVSPDSYRESSNVALEEHMPSNGR